ncbi:hypothetical protein LZ30DRAFT_450757 [Colletotrichum cereale]|nr:hypothetical protein LZ30DRAFT_450757 [Colletotrichum cereale]
MSQPAPHCETLTEALDTGKVMEGGSEATWKGKGGLEKGRRRRIERDTKTRPWRRKLVGSCGRQASADISRHSSRDKTFRSDGTRGARSSAHGCFRRALFWHANRRRGEAPVGTTAFFFVVLFRRFGRCWKTGNREHGNSGQKQATPAKKGVFSLFLSLLPLAEVRWIRLNRSRDTEARNPRFKVDWWVRERD